MTFQNMYQKTLKMPTKFNKLKVQKPWFRWFKGSIWTYIHVLHVTGFSSIPFDDWSKLWSQVLAVEPFFIQGVQSLLTIILRVISTSISYKFTCYHYLCNTVVCGWNHSANLNPSISFSALSLSITRPIVSACLCGEWAILPGNRNICKKAKRKTFLSSRKFKES